MAIESSINEQGLKYNLLSELVNGRSRTHPLVVVDTFGDLGGLYSVATVVFVGGSLSGSGGHSIRPPAPRGHYGEGHEAGATERRRAAPAQR